MWIRRLLVAFAGVAALSACEARFDVEDPVVAAAIDSTLAVAMEGARAADAGRVLSIAEGEGEFTFITGDVLLSGFENIRDAFAATYAGLQSQQQVVLDKRFRLLAPDVALLMVVGEGTYTDKAGWTSDPVGLGLTLVFVREGGQWRARHAHQSVAP
jgi:uncharacterized protein (TIGR02246 family)